jgi:hypothetical protein
MAIAVSKILAAVLYRRFGGEMIAEAIQQSP